ncbi:MAG: hypothetical protein M0P66_06495 [Salinivirgaceae bacterium]|nr:hypothetical protein [Salinivirgaceae bacterium]
MEPSKLNAVLVSLLILAGCATKKMTLNNESLPENQLVIIGMVEYDFSALKNKTIKGIQMYFKTDETHNPLELPAQYLPVQNRRKYEFIALTGNQGTYDLCFRRNPSSGAESGMLLTQLKLERNDSSQSSDCIQKYALNEGKIINLGKIIVTYHGGEIQDSKIQYSYSFSTHGTDSTALKAFKETYPVLYEKYQNELYYFSDSVVEK